MCSCLAALKRQRAASFKGGNDRRTRSVCVPRFTFVRDVVQALKERGGFEFSWFYNYCCNIMAFSSFAHYVVMH